VDFAASPVQKLLADVAGRFEHFTDADNTSVGKLTARYDFARAFALRGTVSTGFRAPTLVEDYYSATNAAPMYVFTQLPPNSAAAQQLGIHKLDPGKSRNFSLGLVLGNTSDPQVSQTGINIFSNGVDTRTRGLRWY